MNCVLIKRVLSFLIPVALVACYLWLSMNMPVSLLARAGHDDAWFIGAAQSMASGQWLGGFNHMALIKGLGFPYFLVLNHWAEFPLTLSQALLYLLACAMLWHVFRQSGAPRWALWLLLTFLLFQPAIFPIRVIRDYVYVSMALMALSGVIGFAVCASERLSRLFVAGAGLGGGFFWITREEGVWILPAFVLGISYGAWMAWRARKTRDFLGRLLLFGLAWLAPIFVTAQINAKYYGVFSTVDFKNPAFKSALNTLNRVKGGEDVRFVPVPEHRRHAIYEVSPAFRELRSYMEGPGKTWTMHGCQAYPHTCGDYAGGWFMWALRDAVSHNGYYNNAVSAEAYYWRLVREIEAACRSGRLKCREKGLIPFMPELSGEAVSELPEKLLQAVSLTLYAGRGAMHNGSSNPPVERLNRLVDFLGGPAIIPPYPTIGDGVAVLQGWYYGPSRGWFEMRCRDGSGIASIEVERRPSLDIARYFRDANAGYQRYDLEVDGSQDCGFYDLATGDLIIDFKGIDSNYRSRIKAGDNTFYVDDIIPSAAKGAGPPRLGPDWMARHAPALALPQSEALRFKGWLFDVYQALSPYVFGAGVLAFLGAVLLQLRRRGVDAGLLVAATCLWVAYFVRIVIVILVDVTSFPAINQLYLLAAFPLVGAASFTSLLAFAAAAAHRRTPA